MWFKRNCFPFVVFWQKQSKSAYFIERVLLIHYCIQVFYSPEHVLLDAKIRRKTFSKETLLSALVYSTRHLRKLKSWLTFFKKLSSQTGQFSLILLRRT